jgi:hypothetical protein
MDDRARLLMAGGHARTVNRVERRFIVGDGDIRPFPLRFYLSSHTL